MSMHETRVQGTVDQVGEAFIMEDFTVLHMRGKPHEILPVLVIPTDAVKLFPPGTVVTYNTCDGNIGYLEHQVQLPKAKPTSKSQPALQPA